MGFAYVSVAALICSLLLDGANAFIMSANRPASSGTYSSLASRRNFLSSASIAAGTAVLAPFAAEAAKYEFEYLQEGTDEFKSVEKATAEFRKAQQAFKNDWQKLMDGFQAAKTDEATISALKAMSGIVSKRNGLPEGIKSQELFKTIRRKKANLKQGGGWQTPVQIAYEELIAIIGNSQKALLKDTSNPL